MSANAVSRLAPAVRRVAVAQRAPRRSASNFNVYVAQRAKQPFVPRGTAVIPRPTRPEPSGYDTKPIITEKQRQAENRTQLSKYIRAGFEMYADQKTFSEFRLPGDELMPNSPILRPDASPLGAETWEDEEAEDEDRLEFVPENEEDYRESFIAEHYEEDVDGKPNEKKEEAEEFDPDMEPEERAMLEAERQRLRKLEEEENPLEELEDGKPLHLDTEDYEEVGEPLNEPKDVNPKLLEYVQGGFAPEEWVHNKEIPAGPMDEPITNEKAAQRAEDEFAELKRDSDFHTELQMMESLQLARNPIEEMMLGDPTVVRDILNAGYRDYEDVPVESMEEETERELNEAEQVQEEAVAQVKITGLPPRVLPPPSFLDPLFVQAAREAAGDMPLPFEDEEIAEAKEALAHGFDPTSRREQARRSAQQAREGPTDEDEPVDEELADEAAAERGDLAKDEARDDEAARDNLEKDETRDEEAAGGEKLTPADELDPELEAEGDDVLVDREAELAELRLQQRLQEEEEKATLSATIDGLSGKVELPTTDHNGEPITDDTEIVISDEASKSEMLKAIATVAAVQLQSDKLKEDMAKSSATVQKEAANYKRNERLHQQFIIGEARDAEFLNQGPLAGTYEAAKLADDRLKAREREARHAAIDQLPLAAALYLEQTMSEEERREHDERLAAELDPSYMQDLSHAQILEDLGKHTHDYSTHEELAEARFENAMLSGDMQRAAATVEDLQHEEDAQLHMDEDAEEHLAHVAKTITPADIKKGKREYLLIKESMEAILDPKNARADNPIAQYMKYGDKPGYEDLGESLRRFATDPGEADEDIQFEEEDEEMVKNRNEKFRSVLRSLVARGHLPMSDAKHLAHNAIDYIFSHSSPRKTAMLKERYISNGNPKPADSRRADFAEYTLSQLQDMLREALLCLQRAMLSMEEKKKIAAGIAADMNDVDAALLRRQRSGFSTQDELHGVAESLLDLHSRWETPEDEVVYMPRDLLFAPQELYRVPDMWRRTLQRPAPHQYEGHVTRGRINFRRKGEHEFERYAKWRTEALEFVSDRIQRDKERMRAAGKL